MKAVWGIIRSSPIGGNFFSCCKKVWCQQYHFWQLYIKCEKLEWQLYVNCILKMFFNVDPLNQLCCTFLLQPLDPSDVSYQISPKYVQLQQVGAIPTSLHTCTPRLPLSGLSWCTIARCTPGLLVPLNNVYAKQVRFLLTDLQNRMFHRAQLHCLLWWLPAICSGVSASIELHKIWKIHFSSWNIDLFWIMKGNTICFVEMWNHRLLVLSFRMEMHWVWIVQTRWWFVSPCVDRIINPECKSDDTVLMDHKALPNYLYILW